MSERSEPVPNAPTLSWSVGRSKTTAMWSPLHDQTWSAFLRWLKPEEPAASKEVMPYVGGTLKNGRRSARTVEQRFFLTLDADYADTGFPTDVALTLQDVPYVIHTTWRHAPEAHRYRLILPLSRGVTPNEHKKLAWSVMNLLGGDQFDQTTAQAERFMWGPSTRNADEYFHQSANTGAPYLPVDVWLDARHGLADGPEPAAGANTPPPPAATRSEAYSASATAEDIERAEEILADAVDAVLHVHEREDFSGRNEAVFHMLPLLLQFSQAGALDQDLVLDSLFNAAQQVPSDEPYSRQEFDASVGSALRYAEEEGPSLPETTRTKLAIADFEGIEEEVDLWEATPQLRHIAQAADSLGRNRLALLATTLTRVLVRADAGICLPGVEDGAVGSRAAINLGVALVGTSGQGKSSIYEKSGELIPTPGVSGKPSTGQGLMQEFLKWDDDLGENVLIEEPRRLFLIDEVETLNATSQDKTSTLMSELRTMLTGGMTGTSNATAVRKRLLPARSYNMQIVVGVQPSRSGMLLNDRDAGTPQRFIWAEVTDPQRAVRPEKRPPWPGPLPWDDAFLLGFELFEPVVDYPQWLKDELREYDYKVSLEGMEGGEVSRDAHRHLLRLKVSAGIAFLHMSPVIEDEHVQLADQILRRSMKTQRDCETLLAKTEFERKKSGYRSESRVKEVIGEEKIARLVKNAKKALEKVDGDLLTWHQIRPAHRDRAEWGEAVWEALVEDDEVKTTEETVGDGKIQRHARWIG
jgi:hypothetical protein